ncbi:MAG: hypothetical protein JWL85_433 [Candidatus Saccharibacteria bacterium]|nr:hypothetical protein [Candidatus Saccharibacteria bacterium]
MKQKDLMLIIVIGIVSAVFSILISNATIGSQKHRKQQVEVVEPITAQFSEPDKRYFNGQSVNPTQLIQIQNNTNSKPFN